jgi:ribosomal protein S26
MVHIVEPNQMEGSMAKSTKVAAKSSTSTKSKGKAKVEELKTDKKGKVLPTREAIDKMKMAIPVVIDGQPLIGSKKQFKKGSVGYNTSGKVIIDGCVCQVSCNIVVVGSKELAKNEGFEPEGDDDDNDE